MKSTEEDLHLLATKGFGKVGKFLEGLTVYDLRVTKTEDENGAAISAVFVDSFNDLVNVLVKV